jgi:hypothetical protein
MSKYNVGIGEDFPLEDGPESGARSRCEARWQAHRERMHHFRHRRHRHGMYAPAAAFVVLPAAVATVTVAVLYPLVTLGVIGGAGLVAAAYRRGHWDQRDWQDFKRRHRDDRPRNEPPRDEGPQPDAPPKENL